MPAVPPITPSFRYFAFSKQNSTSLREVRDFVLNDYEVECPENPSSDLNSCHFAVTLVVNVLSYEPFHHPKAQKVHSPITIYKKCISEVVRIGSIIIFHLTEP